LIQVNGFSFFALAQYQLYGTNSSHYRYTPTLGKPEKPLANQFRGGSSHCMIRAGFLDPESQNDLIELGRDGSVAHRLARRANALVLLDDGMSCGEVAKILLLDDGTVRTWYRLCEDEGIEGLASFGHDGSACRLSDAQQAM
jgi:Winged helix-turn helix